MADTSSTLVDLLRHGEPRGGTKFRGYTDDPLSEQGWAQMRAAVQPDEQWDVMVTSPLLRCAEFAAELAGSSGIPLETDVRFQEIGFGEWEGRTYDELRLSAPGHLELFLRDPANRTPPGGEKLDAFIERVTAAWDELLARHDGKRILLVAHGGVNRVILCHALQIPTQNLFRLEVKFAGRSRIRVLGGGAESFPQLVFHGSPQP
ncbi:MAG: alpha-ribazole phosphatase family protein [Sulfuricella sp.]|nr:alpha-ribazole phosphatase family protein [Sulfuricella sp.]